MTWRCRFTLMFYTAAFIFSLSAGAENSLSSSSFNQKGMDELHGNHPERAIDFFLHAISIDSKQKHYYNNLAASYMRTGEYLKAEEQLKISLQIDANYARALSNMSVTLFHLGRYRESYKYYILTKKADSEYTEQRFDKKKVTSYIQKSSEENPDDKALKKIKEYMESDAAVEERK